MSHRGVLRYAVLVLVALYSTVQQLTRNEGQRQVDQQLHSIEPYAHVHQRHGRASTVRVQP